MESLVAPDVLSRLSQILSNLVLGDNDVRKAAEKTLSEEWLAKDPSNVLIALAEFTRKSPDPHMRSFAAVLLRRLIFRPAPTTTRLPTDSTIYDYLPEAARKTIETLLLDCLSNELVSNNRNKIIDTVSTLAEGSLDRHRPWPELQAFAAQYTMSSDPVHREIAFKIFANVPRLILDQEPDEVVGVLEKGLSAENEDIQLAALKASAAFLTATDKTTRRQAARLMTPMLNTLPPLPPASLAPFLHILIPLATSDPGLFRPHLASLIAYLPPLVHRRSNEPTTPTATDPTPTPGLSSTPNGDDKDGSLEDTRYAALELLVTLTESTPKAAEACEPWIPSIVRCCLEGMAEIDDGSDDEWLARDPSEEGEEDGYPVVFEESLDRTALAIRGAILPTTFQYVPVMLNSADWKQRHAGLMAVCSVAEGANEFMENEFGKVIELILPLFADPHPRVRTAACHCIGVLCSDVGHLFDEQYQTRVLRCLAATLLDPEARVHSHAAAALVNFCTLTSREIITPLLEPIIKGLIQMLNGSSKGYVQRQALTTIAMVADAASKSFRQFYPSLFPLLTIVIKNATSKPQRALRCRAIECASLIAHAVGRDMFLPNAPEFCGIILEIQNSMEADDAETPHYVMATWARVAEVLKTDFGPYLQYVMPNLFKGASLKQEMAILSDDEAAQDSTEWQVITVGHQQIGIRTAVLEEKSAAFENIVKVSTSLGPAFAPYVQPVLELCLPTLRYPYHEGVKESSAMLIPILISCGKQILSPQDLQTVFRSILAAINDENDPGFLSSLYKAMVDSMVLMPSFTLPDDLTHDIVATTQSKLQGLGQRRRQREVHLQNQPEEDSIEDREDMALLEELEDFMLEEIGRLLKLIDPNHQLLITVSSIRDLAVINVSSEY